MSRLSRSSTPVLWAVAGLCLSTTAARGQAIERHLPPAVKPEAQVLVPPNATPASQDDRPLGPALSAILLLGNTDVPRDPGFHGVITGLVPRIDSAATRSDLGRFLGRPLSRRLIAEIEGEVARLYRQAGYPLVSLSTPPQALEGGALQIRVVEFRDAQVNVSGVGGRAARRVRAGVRLQPGEAVASGLLSDDLDWLNRYPFRHVGAVFSPGAAFATTDLDLVTTAAKPWQVYAGYANSGSAQTTWDRYFLGAQVGGLLVPDSVLGYQFTVSPDVFDDHGKAFGQSHPRYISQGLRGAVPVGQRQDVEFSLDHVETNTPSQDFVIRQITDETSVGYRSALSNFTRILPGDVTAGLDAKQEQRKTLFGGSEVLYGAVEVYQLYAGWAYAGADPLGRTTVNFTVHESPGGLDHRNSDADFGAFTQGRVRTADYQYASLQLDRITRLPHGWSLSNSVLAQYADAPLPDTEALEVGGPDLVRGYTLDDGAFDDAFVLRNELHAPALQPVRAPALLATAIAPYAFVDVGYGHDLDVRKTTHPLSTGLAGDAAFGPWLSLSASAAYAIDRGADTKAGSGLFQMRAVVKY